MLPLLLKDNSLDFTGVIYVYKIINNINGKYYIGVHKHVKGIDNYMGSGTLINLSLLKYGVDNFTKEILKEFETYEEALTYESELVTMKEVNDENCYNMIPGGNGGSVKGRKLSDITKEKISNSKLGNKNPMFGKSISDKQKDSIRNANYKRVYAAPSIETRNKMSISQQDRSKEWLEKLSLKATGKKHSEETKEKIRLSNLGKKIPADVIAKRVETRRINKLKKLES